MVLVFYCILFFFWVIKGLVFWIVWWMIGLNCLLLWEFVIGRFVCLGWWVMVIFFISVFWCLLGIFILLILKCLFVLICCLMLIWCFWLFCFKIMLILVGYMLLSGWFCFRYMLILKINLGIFYCMVILLSFVLNKVIGLNFLFCFRFLKIIIILSCGGNGLMRFVL